jgi:hypothetical protein
MPENSSIARVLFHRCFSIGIGIAPLRGPRSFREAVFFAACYVV